MKILIILFIALDSLINPPLSDTNKAFTATEVQELKAEVYKLFDLYEEQYHLCLNAKENIRLVSLQAIEENLRELQRLEQYVASSNLTIQQLQKTESALAFMLKALQQSLRKAKRKAWFERAGYLVVTSAIIVVISNKPP